MELVAFLGKDKENWGQVNALINRMKWDKIILVKNKNAESVQITKEHLAFEINSDLPMLEMRKEIMDKLKPALKGDFEVALSIATGNGKEHMALISALLNLPVGIKLAVYTQKGVEFLT